MEAETTQQEWRSSLPVYWTFHSPMILLVKLHSCGLLLKVAKVKTLGIGMS